MKKAALGRLFLGYPMAFPLSEANRPHLARSRVARTLGEGGYVERP